MKKISHYVKNYDWPYDSNFSGVMRVKAWYHGDSTPEEFYVQGSHILQNYPKNNYISTVFGKFGPDYTMGLSGFTVDYLLEFEEDG